MKSFKSVWSRWHHLANIQPTAEAIIHWRADEKPIRWTYSSIINRANFYSEMLLNAGVKPGDVCAIIIRHNPEFYPIYMGVAGIGALPAVLAYPNPRLHPDKFRQGILGMSQRSGLDFILTENALEEIIKPLVASEESTIKDLLFPLELSDEIITENNQNIYEMRNSFQSSDPFLLQHSSGTTGLQKPVLLSNRAVLDHIKYYGDAINLNENDKVVSWLPLYHDMGLVAAFHLPLVFGITSVQIDPFEWVLAPQLLLDVITEEKGTITWLPNFAYNILADKIPDYRLEDVNLKSIRLVINCSEPVRNYSHKKFVSKYVNYGLNPIALSTCYAMAETTFAVTQNPPEAEIPELKVERDSLSKGIVKLCDDSVPYRICVSSGKLIEGCKIRIVDENRNELPEGCVGEIAISSVSMFDGYRNYPEKTAEALNDGLFFSGDYGFRFDGHFYIIGRKKDIIIVAGNNIYPEDIEDMVSNVKGIIPGRVVAFGEEDEIAGTEIISVVAETSLDKEEDKKKLTLEIKKIAMGIDITITKIYLVPPKWLIKSSAGKPSRSANKERILKK
jgi:fatty-acyl-CoA synthase